MKEQKSGKIINISSSIAFWGTPNFLYYVASKAALIDMMRSLGQGYDGGMSCDLTIGTGAKRDPLAKFN